MRFADPLWLALLVVPAGELWRRWRGRKRAPSERLAFPGLSASLSALSDLPRTARLRWRWLPPALKWGGTSLMIVALARPQTVVDAREIHSRARNIVVALDISSSMKATDFQPGNRLEVARRVIGDFVRRRDGDLIGLVIFAGRAFLQAPLNADTHLLGTLIDRVEIGMLPDGTAIGTALALSLSQLKDLPRKASVVILITDGANNTGRPTPLEAAEAARALGIRVHAIGLSTADTVGPADRSLWREGRQADRLTSSDEAVLRRITSRAGGHYYRATDPDALERILHDIDPIERADVRIAEIRDYREWFSLVLGAGLLLLVVEVCLEAGWLRRLP